MVGVLSLWGKMGSIARRSRGRRTKPRVLFVRDPELLGIAQISDRRRLDMKQSLERVFEKVKPILNRQLASESPIREPELPPALLAKVVAIPDAEQRIRAIVEFKLSARKQTNVRKDP